MNKRLFSGQHVVADGGFRGEDAVVVPFWRADATTMEKKRHNERLAHLRWKFESFFNKVKSFKICRSVHRRRLGFGRPMLLTLASLYNIDVVKHPLIKHRPSNFFSLYLSKHSVVRARKRSKFKVHRVIWVNPVYRANRVNRAVRVNGLTDLLALNALFMLIELIGPNRVNRKMLQVPNVKSNRSHPGRSLWEPNRSSASFPRLRKNCGSKKLRAVQSNTKRQPFQNEKNKSGWVKF